MTNLSFVDGDIIDSDAQYIAHQTNCLTSHAAGLAKAIFQRFPYADVYSARAASKMVDEPGSIVVCGDGIQQRFVINMMGQYYPGSNRIYPASELDGAQARLRYFYRCLHKISLLPDLSSIAFPYGIGCGMAGGKWDDYLFLLERFSEHVKDRASVSIVKLPEK
jgi:O-acetyl-ADP-ribose deacetylase (regulator of RNase III)